MRPNLLIILPLVITAGAQPYVVSTVAGGSLPATPNAATAVSLGTPARVALDPAGNIYFGSDNILFKVDRTGTLTVVAGTSRPGCTGDGGPALAAQVRRPAGIAFDSRGNLYFADTLCNVVRTIDPAGNIKTIAGSGPAGNSGDGGPAISARLNAPAGITFDAAGNLYIADPGNHLVRRVLAADGSIGTYAGNGAIGAETDNVAAALSSLATPVDVAFDSDGNLYIADRDAEVIRMVNPKGIITTFAGTGNFGAASDSPVPTRSAFEFPSGLFWDVRSRSLFITDSYSVRVVSQDGIRTLAGGGGPSAPALVDGQPAMGTSFTSDGIGLDASGNMFVATKDSRVWRISPTGIASVVAGNGFAGYTGDGGAAIGAQFRPSCVAVDRSQNFYVADQAANVVRKISGAGTITTVAGTGQAGNSGDGGLAVKARLTPSCVSVDKAGNLYIPDATHSVVRRVSVSDGTITTVAGNGTFGIAGDEGQGIQAQLESPVTTAADFSGNLYIGDAGACAIRKVTPDGVIHTIAGHLTQATQQLSTACYSFVSGDGIAATSAGLNQPVSVTVDAQNNVWFVDQGVANANAPTGAPPSDYIRKITPDGAIHMIAGQGANLADNIPAATAVLSIQTTSTLVVDSAGNVFFNDANRVRKIDTKGILTTVAGDGKPGYTGDGGAALQAEFSDINDIAIDTSGDLYAADLGAGAIRLLRPGTPASGPTISAVANAASNQAGAVAPGEIVTIYGSGLGPAAVPPVTAAPGANGVYPTVLSGTSVLFNGSPAPMIYTSATQVAAVVPYEVSGATVQVSVQYQNAAGQAVTVPVASTAPALFTLGSGTGQAAAVNQDGSLNGAAHPAPPGSIVVLFATGEGATTPSGMDGSVTGSTLPQPLLAVTVTIGGVAANVLYAGEAPQEIAGVMQLNVVVPAGVTAGSAVPILVKVGNSVSPAGVTIAVSQN
jgi:uncharacterized protein (TIGR03437 family)